MAMFEAQLEGLQELRLRFQRMPSSMAARLPSTMRDVCEMVAAQARANMARMFKNPEKMQSTVAVEVEEGPVNVRGTVSASGLPYLAIQEYGGVVHIPEIVPVNARALHWLAPAQLGFSGNGAQEGVYAMRAQAHDVHIPERSYMRAALAQKQREIIAEFEKATTEVSRAA